MSVIKLYFFHLLPKNLLSRIVGKGANITRPKFIVRLAIYIFRLVYKIDLSQAKEKSFSSFNEFFTRQLQAQYRPLNKDPQTVISPVDGGLGCWGKIENGILFQAKGLEYSLADLLGQKPEYEEFFTEGDYMTIYLSPRHYHRIHSPCSAQVKELYYIPGTLYPVNPFAVQNVPRLFARNERLITLLESETVGKVAVIKVGATIVGKIKVVYDSVESNIGKNLIHKTYEDVSLERGDELGKFELGSTVILLFQKNKIRFPKWKEKQEFLYGEMIAEVLEK